MERRVLVAIALSFAVLFFYQALFIPPAPVGRNDAPAAPSPASAPSVIAGAPPGAAAVQAPPAAPQVTTVGDTSEREVVLETPLVRAVFSNRGGHLRQWVLKSYRDDGGRPIDLVPATVPPDLARPFSLRVDDPAVTPVLNDALYRVVQDGQTVRFDMESSNGWRVQKTFALDPSTYLLTFSTAVTANGSPVNPTVQWGPGVTDEIALTPPGSFLSPAYLYPAQAIFHTGSEVERHAKTSIPDGSVYEGQYRWAGVDDHYFISAVVQPQGAVRLEYRPVTINSTATPPVPGNYMTWAMRFAQAPDNVRFYLGPKQLDVMRAIDPELTRAIYFGMFDWLAAPLLEALKWVYGFVQSWGWAIIVLTVIINLVMFPLRHMSVVSMRKMQLVQPQLKAIQERYAKYKITDPERQKMNSEVMELYKQHGVNPASGCLPNLLTLPLLFAFYAMLGQAIEIRGESFWWIPNLAVQDPLFILPAFMGATMYWQQKIMPATMDPTQQRIMMMMPIMITVTMLFAPAGLVLYWSVSQAWGIGQQYFTNWMIGAPPAPAGTKPKPPKASPPDIVVSSPRGKK